METASYVASYVNNALNCPEVVMPDQSQSGEFHEVLTGLYNAHNVAGNEGAKIAWAKLTELMPELSQIAKTPSKRKLYSVSDLALLPPVEWLIPGMLPKRTLTEIHGAPGSGKSFFVLQVALLVSESVPVVYLAAEGSSGYRGRLKAWELAHNKNASRNIYFTFEVVNLLDKNEVAAFIETIKPLKPGLVIIDTLACCMVGADENSGRDMGIGIHSSRSICSELDAAVLLVHHTGKSGSVERGHSALRGACDSMIELSNNDDVITVSSSKLKDGKAFETQHFTMKEFSDSVALIPADKPKTQSANTKMLKENDLKVLEMLNLSIFQDTGATCKRIIEHTSIAPKTLDKVLSRLKTDGYLSQSKRGEPYLITDKGCAQVSSILPSA